MNNEGRIDFTYELIELLVSNQMDSQFNLISSVYEMRCHISQNTNTKYMQSTKIIMIVSE